MTDSHEWKDVASEARFFAKCSVCILIDTLYLALWALVQWLIGKLIVYLGLSGVDSRTLLVFEYLFAFSTVAPIVVFFVVDITIMVLRAWRAVKAEYKRSAHNGDMAKATPRSK